MNEKKIQALWVDDIRSSPDDTWQVARTVTSAIQAIALFEFDEYSLDHDISHQIHLGRLSRPYPCEENFQAVAHFIGMKHKVRMIDEAYKEDALPAYVTHDYTHPYQPPKIHIHSSNPYGAEQIQRILKDYGLSATYGYTKPANRLEMEI